MQHNRLVGRVLCNMLKQLCLAGYSQYPLYFHYLSIKKKLVHQWYIFQMDVKFVFLNGDVQEVYMVPPPSVSQNHDEVYKPKKTFYDLK